MMDVNEDSLDLYTDLISEDYSNQPSKTNSGESQQQISEVLDTAKATIESLQLELQDKVKKEAELQKRIEILEKNNSSLLLTAKSELGRKNSLISDLRDQIDEHTKSLFYNGKFNKYPDKHQGYCSRKSEKNQSFNARKRKNEEAEEQKDSKRCRTTRRSGTSVTKYDREIESENDKMLKDHSSDYKVCNAFISDNITPCDRTTEVPAQTFDLRDKLRRKDKRQRQNNVSKSFSKSNGFIITNVLEDPKYRENQTKGGLSKSDTDETSLSLRDKVVLSAVLSEREKKLQKSSPVKVNSKCSIMDVVNKLSNKANENKSNFVIPKQSKKSSTIVEDAPMDNKVLDSSLSAESSDETERLIVDFNSASDLNSPLNSQPSVDEINIKSNDSQSKLVNVEICDLNGNTEKVAKTFPRKEKPTASESDSDFTSKLQYCVNMLSDSDQNETEVWNTNQTLDTSTSRVKEVNDMDSFSVKYVSGKITYSSNVENVSESELMSPPKSVLKKKKFENKNLSTDSESQKCANRNPIVPEQGSNIFTDSSLNLVQNQSVVNRILNLSKSVALNVQTQNVNHRPSVENNYEEPKHNTMTYFTWKTPKKLTFSDKNLQISKYREQNRVLGIQDVPLSDPRTKITRDNIIDTKIVSNAPKPISNSIPNSRMIEAASIVLMSKQLLNKKVNASGPDVEKQNKDLKKSSSKSKDCEKVPQTKTDRKDNDGIKVRLDLPHKRQSSDKTVVKTSQSEILSDDNNKQQKTVISGCEDRELPTNSTDLKKTPKKSSRKKPSKSNMDEKSASKTKSLTRKSAKAKDATEKYAIDNDLRHELDTDNINKEKEHSERKSITEIVSNETVATASPPSPKSNLPFVDTKVESHSVELTNLETVTKPNDSIGISNQFQSIEDIEVKSEPYSEPAPLTSSGLSAISGMFMTNLAGTNNETEFMKRLKKIEDEIQMLKSAAMQSLQTKVISKTEYISTNQESESQPILGSGTNDNPIIIPSSSDVAKDISQAPVSGSDSTLSESGNVETQSDIRPDESRSKHKSSENVSKDVDSSMSPVKTSNISKCVSKTIPIQGAADSSSGPGASQSFSIENMTKVSMNSTDNSNSSHNSSFSVHSAESSVSSSYNTNNVRNSFTKHETLVSCNNSDTDDTLSDSSEDENDMDIEADPHSEDLNQNAAEVLKTDLNMSSDSEDASKDHSNILPQTVETPNAVVNNVKTPIKQDMRSPWNRISPVPKFVSPENVNCDSKLLALVNLATLDLHLSGHDVPFENKSLSSKNENNSDALPEVLSSTPCFRKTRSHGKSSKNCLPEIKNNDVINSNMTKFDNHQINSDLSNSHPTPAISPPIVKSPASKSLLAKCPVDNLPIISCDTPASPEFEVEKSTKELKTRFKGLKKSSEEIQLLEDVKSPNIEDFKIFQSVENDTVGDTLEHISEKEDGEITQDSIIVSDNHKQLSVNTNSVYFVIDTKVDENDELFKCSDAENSVLEKPDKKLVTPKKKTMCSVKTRSSPRIRSKASCIRDRLGVPDKTERRASDSNNKRKRCRRSPSPRPQRSDGRRRLYENDNVKSAHKSARKPLTDSARARDGDNDRIRNKDEPRRRSSRDRSNRDRNRSGNYRGRS